MNLFKMMLGGNDAAGKMLDAGLKGIDAIVYTDEEKAQAQQKLMDGWQALEMKRAESGTGTAINRRIISWAVVIVILFNFQIAVVLAIMGWHEPIQSILLLTEKFFVGEAFVSVLVFYFGPHLLGSLRK